MRFADSSPPQNLYRRFELYLAALGVPWQEPEGDLAGWNLLSDYGVVTVTYTGETDEFNLASHLGDLGRLRDDSDYLFKLLEANGSATAGARFDAFTGEGGACALFASAGLTASTLDLEEIEMGLLGVLRLVRLVRRSHFFSEPVDPPLEVGAEVGVHGEPGSGPIDTDGARPRPPSDASGSDRGLEDLLLELNSLTGLGSVKNQVTTLSNLINVQQARADQGFDSEAISHHMVFLGPPGTGKTTVARLVAQILRALGLLEQGHLVEAARQDLVAGYVGQTATKTNEVIDRALGGVLFIDEAYSLSRDSTGNDYGGEAIETLLKRMEDDRDKFVVIVAGYDAEMHDFLAANPGLKSRFNRMITFPGYEPHELCEILIRMSARQKYQLTPEALGRATSVLTAAWEGRDARFGNARAVRNLFETSISAHANRVARLDLTDGRNLTLIEAADIPVVV